MCLSVNKTRKPDGASEFEKDENGNYIVYKVITVGNQSPFYAGNGYQWNVGGNVANIPYYEVGAEVDETTYTIDGGFHMLASIRDAEVVKANLSEGRWNQWEFLGVNGFKIIRATVAPENVIAEGLFLIDKFCGGITTHYCFLSLSADVCLVESLDDVSTESKEEG
jgi:hypothetical protein